MIANLTFVHDSTALSLGRLSDPAFLRAALDATKAFAVLYREHHDAYQPLHSFLARELSAVPNFHFHLSPVLPPLPLQSPLAVRQFGSPYRRFVLPKPTIMALPPLTLNAGHTVRVVEGTDAAQTDAAVEEFLQYLAGQPQTHGRMVIGFDTESRAVFRPNVPNSPISLLQLASDSHALLVRLIHKRQPTLPASLLRLLMDPDIVKVGQSIGGDLKLLVEQFQLPRSALSAPKQHSFVDLSDISEPFKFAAPGLQSLVAGLMGNHLSKAQQCSNWEARPSLSPKQIEYAALDAIVSKQLYHRLHELREPFNQPVHKFAEEKGWDRKSIAQWLIK